MMRQEVRVRSIAKITAGTIAAFGVAVFMAGFALLIVEFYMWSKTGQVRPVISWLYWQRIGMPASVWATLAGGLLAVVGAIISGE
jgi:hypothetical protein